uniref:Hexosyltransferase n=1 Tax=Brassica oleracea var. oleracea TaxID=109376 RepID=A0A0D3A7Q5_BRAOL
MLKGEHVKISQSYAINLPRQLIPFVNTQSYRLFLKYLSVTFPLHSTASKILSSPIDLPTIKINNCTIQHNTLFNFFPFPNLAIYTVRFKTKVPHIVIPKSTSINHWDEVVVTNDLQMDEDEDEDDNEEDDQEVYHRNRANKNVISWDVGVCDVENLELPRLVYLLVRPGFDYHKKAGAMKSLIRVSGFLSIVPYLLNVDCDHYIYNTKILREEMCFVLASKLGKKICYDHYPQRFDGIGRHGRYSNGSVVFYDVSTQNFDHQIHHLPYLES